MNEKDAQVLIRHLQRRIQFAEREYETIKAGRDEVAPWEAVEMERLLGSIGGLKSAISLIEDAVGESA